MRTYQDLWKTAGHLAHDASQCEYYEGDGLYVNREMTVAPFPLDQEPEGYVLVLKGEGSETEGLDFNFNQAQQAFVRILIRWDGERNSTLTAEEVGERSRRPSKIISFSSAPSVYE